MHRNVSILIMILFVFAATTGILWVRGKFFAPEESVSILSQVTINPTSTPTPTIIVTTPSAATISATEASPTSKLVKPASASAGRNVVE